MPYDEPDPSDPNVLVGVDLPGDADSVREMAYAFAEEYASLGYSEEQTLHLFHHTSYAGPAAALAFLGEVEIRRIVRECLDVWRHVRFVVTETPQADSGLLQIRLPSKRGEET